ncbi:uncharacterized protein LOC114941846 [Nylanderia fulva]|uniref:uncharacterized protein LOC114941846 n=1 Tax=Nylanderia fulva TaxID=613905 RepID=UPI0010FB8C5D|nr:uncharacterized protein LOC114941846 [Nylanderia fulva]
MSFDENIDKSENRDENECIDESENRDENENINKCKGIDESENTDESIYESENTNKSENGDENVNTVFENDQQKENYVILALRQWALSGGVISMSKIDELLAKLQPVFNNLPKCYKTLLKIDDDIHITHFENRGQFWYRGIKNYLDGLNLKKYLQVKQKIEIDINTDGLPLFRSSKKKFWPILGHLVGTKNYPFIIAIYFGNSDPNNVKEFLQDFVTEVDNLISNGYVRYGKTFIFLIRHYILDAPARELIKCCIGHNGYASCEKCTVWGERLDYRQTYIDLHAPLRTDESFKNQMQPRHHKGVSPLLQLNTKMVSQFRLEPMHLVYEGVFKRLLEAWKNWISPWKLHWTVVNRISDRLILLAPSCPQDFARKPRSLHELSFYKATEFRRLCLYDGIAAFASHPDINIYKHFLLLHCGIYILTSPILYKSFNEYANTLLRTFIQHSITLFGKLFVVYNVHSLCHLAQECIDHGCLDTFSAFRYENKLKMIKSNLKSGFKPIQQAAKRELEQICRFEIYK